MYDFLNYFGEHLCVQTRPIGGNIMHCYGNKVFYWLYIGPNRNYGYYRFYPGYVGEYKVNVIGLCLLLYLWEGASNRIVERFYNLQGFGRFFCYEN